MFSVLPHLRAVIWIALATTLTVCAERHAATAQAPFGPPSGMQRLPPAPGIPTAAPWAVPARSPPPSSRGDFYHSLEEPAPAAAPMAAPAAVSGQAMRRPLSAAEAWAPSQATGGGYWELARRQSGSPPPAAPGTAVVPNRLPNPAPINGGPSGVVDAAAGPPRLAEQPRSGDHFPAAPPCASPGAALLGVVPGDFAIDPAPPTWFDPSEELAAYDAKRATDSPQPPLALGRPFYGYGPFEPAGTLLGKSNLITPQFLVYGDWRTALASHRTGDDSTNELATRLTLDVDYKLTATERLHATWAPLNRGAQFTRLEFDSQRAEFFDELNFNPQAGYFEGDLGAIVGGAIGVVQPFDAPFAVGAMPLLYQNGVWLEDTVTGLAYTIPARHSTFFDVSNFDLTFLIAWDGVSSPAFQQDNGAAKLYGATVMVEAWDGYLEIGYAFLEDRREFDRSYHNIGCSWTRRYGGWLSNSVRVIANVGQDPVGVQKTADGAVLMIDNSLITRHPSTLVPYCNMWIGIGRPQAAARAPGAGGLLVHSGILLESDGLTNYPTLDASAADSWGAALGVNLLPSDFSQQLVVEAAFVNVLSRAPFFRSATEQYGLGVRYQRPLTNALIFRADAMLGVLGDGDELAGARMELRRKF